MRRQSVVPRPILALVGAGGVAQTLIAPRGIAYAGGEAWSARSTGPEIAPGSAVKVVGVEGLELIVEPGSGSDRAGELKPEQASDVHGDAST
jgi:membrane-bound ClpP family serine protease